MSILTKGDRARIKKELNTCTHVTLGVDDTATIMLILYSALDTIDAMEAERDAYRRLARVTSPYIYELISRSEFIEWLEEHGWTWKGDATSRKPDRMVKGGREIYMGRSDGIPGEAFMDAADEANTVSRALAADILAKSLVNGRER